MKRRLRNDLSGRSLAAVGYHDGPGPTGTISANGEEGAFVLVTCLLLVTRTY